MNLGLAEGKMETRTKRLHTTGCQECPRAESGGKKNARAHFGNQDGVILPQEATGFGVERAGARNAVHGEACPAVDPPASGSVSIHGPNL